MRRTRGRQDTSHRGQNNPSQSFGVERSATQCTGNSSDRVNVSRISPDTVVWSRLDLAVQLLPETDCRVRLRVSFEGCSAAAGPDPEVLTNSYDLSRRNHETRLGCVGDRVPPQLYSVGRSGLFESQTENPGSGAARGRSGACRAEGCSHLRGVDRNNGRDGQRRD